MCDIKVKIDITIFIILWFLLDGEQKKSVFSNSPPVLKNKKHNGQEVIAQKNRKTICNPIFYIFLKDLKLKKTNLQFLALVFEYLRQEIVHFRIVLPYVHFTSS